MIHGYSRCSVNYRYRSHNIEMLSHKAVGLDSEFAIVFPMDTEQQRENFKLVSLHSYMGRIEGDWVFA